MKSINRIFSLSLTLCALVMVGCMDNDFRLEEVSTEVTVGQGETILPLGYLEKKSLGELIPEDVEGLTTDAEGNYHYRFAGEQQHVTVEGIQTTIELPATEQRFFTDYPSFLPEELAHNLDQNYILDANMQGEELLNAHYTIPAGVHITDIEEDSIVHHVEYDLPEHIEAVERIYLKPTAEGDPGARVDAVFNLNSLSVVNGGGSIDLRLDAPAGYEIYDAEGSIASNNELYISRSFAEGEDELRFVFYVAAVENYTQVTDGHMSMPVEIHYHLSYTMDTIAGELALESFPTLKVSSLMEYRDADVVLSDKTLFEHAASESGDVEISNLPAELLSINNISFKEGASSPIELKVSGFDWADTELAEAIMVEASLPEHIRLRASENYDSASNTLTVTLAELREGAAIDVAELDFGQEGLVPEEGRLTLALQPSFKGHFKPHARLKLSALENAPTTLDVRAAMASTMLDIESISGRVDYSYNELSTIDFGMEEPIDLTINGVGLFPVFIINVHNPLTMSAYIDATIYAVNDDQRQEDKALKINDVSVAAASYKEGVIEPTVTTIVLGDKRYAEQYSGPNEIFVECDITKLLLGQLPEKLDLDIVISTPTTEVCTLYAADEYTVMYDYAMEVPLVVDNRFDISYGGEFDGLAETFGDLSEMDIRVGDAAVIANITNTTPLGLELWAELFDKEGNATPAQLVVPDNSPILGSKDGKSEAKSTVRLEFDLPGGELQSLAEVDGIRIRVGAKSAAVGEVKLNKEQYIDLMLQLEVKGGVTIDLETL